MAAINGPVRIKRSTVSGEVPQPADLVTGEIAGNTADGKLFIKHSDGTVKEVGGTINSTGIEEAPNDGQQYARQNEGWVTVAPPASTIDALTDVDTSTTPPTDGQALVWIDANSQWEPGTISTSAAAPVDSVNGETGAVSLGIQDMDDFELPPGAVTAFRYNWTGGDSGNGSHYTASFSGVIKDILKYVDADGNDSTAYLPADNATASVWHSFDQVTWTEVSGTWNRVDVTQRIDLTGAALPRSYGSSLYITWTDPATVSAIPLAEGDTLKWDNADSKFKPSQLPEVIDKATLKAEVAASTDFADFQSRIAAL